MEDEARLPMPDARRFGRIRLQHEPERELPVSGLGFDPLLGLPTASELRAALARRRAPIKSVLLDQGLFAGVGNWIADEVLYQAGLRPQRLASGVRLEGGGRRGAGLGSVVDQSGAVGRG